MIEKMRIEVKNGWMLLLWDSTVSNENGIFCLVKILEIISYFFFWRKYA